MTRLLVLVWLGLIVGCSRGPAQRIDRWTASCDACSWRTSGAVKHGVDYTDGDRCPRTNCRGRLVVRVLDKGTPASAQALDDTRPEPSFGLERYNR